MRTLLLAGTLLLSACGTADDEEIVIEGEAPPTGAGGQLTPDATLQPGGELAPDAEVVPGPELQPDATLQPDTTGL